jgi:hypothetical protein
MSGVELFLGGVAMLAVLTVIIKARLGLQRVRVAREIARVGTSPVSLIGRVLVTALVIVGVQWLVITRVADVSWWWAALGLPALVAAYAVTKALTVTEIRPRRRRGDRR